MRARQVGFAAALAGLVSVASPLGVAARSRAPAEARPTAASCPGADVDEAVRRVEGTGEIVLGSDHRIVLADIRLPASAAPGGSAGPDGLSARAGGPSARPDGLAWLGTLAGQPVSVRAVGAPDRWGRDAAVVALREGEARIDLAELLVAEGLALVDPGERDALCRPDLLALEAEARARRRGLWASGTTLVPADRADLLRERNGRFAVVEGRVVSVGERRDRTYLNFGRDISRDFAAVVPKRTWLALKASGISAESLRGQTVRLRGVVEIRRAPVIELAVPALLERPAPGQGTP